MISGHPVNAKTTSHRRPCSQPRQTRNEKARRRRRGGARWLGPYPFLSVFSRGFSSRFFRPSMLYVLQIGIYSCSIEHIIMFIFAGSAPTHARSLKCPNYAFSFSPARFSAFSARYAYLFAACGHAPPHLLGILGADRSGYKCCPFFSFFQIVCFQLCPFPFLFLPINLRFFCEHNINLRFFLRA